MSKQPSKALIGAFVVGALTLVVGAVIILGSGAFLKKKPRYVMYFEGSAKGLAKGAPVLFRGIKIGQVIEVHLIFSVQDLSLLIEVISEFDPESLTVVGGKAGGGEYHDKLLEKGMRAQLQLQSFVTGLLVINLDFYPDKPAKVYGLNQRYPEVPTIPQTLEEITKTIEDLKLDELVKNVKSAIEGIDRFVNSPTLKQSVVSLDRALKSVDTLSKTLNSEIPPLSANLKETSLAVKDAFRSADRLITENEKKVDDIVTNVRDTIKTIQTAVQRAEDTLRTLEGMARRNENLGFEVQTALDEFSATSRSLRILTDYLEQHPEAFIRGKRSR
jgi:paraquat-inducible protein B